MSISTPIPTIESLLNNVNIVDVYRAGVYQGFARLKEVNEQVEWEITFKASAQHNENKFDFNLVVEKGKIKNIEMKVKHQF